MKVYILSIVGKNIKKVSRIISSPIQLPIDVLSLSKYIQIWKFVAFNSIFYCAISNGKVKEHNAWNENPILILISNMYYMDTTYFFNLLLNFLTTFVKQSSNIIV